MSRVCRSDSLVALLRSSFLLLAFPPFRVSSAPPFLRSSVHPFIRSSVHPFIRPGRPPNVKNLNLVAGLLLAACVRPSAHPPVVSPAPPGGASAPASSTATAPAPAPASVPAPASDSAAVSDTARRSATPAAVQQGSPKPDSAHLSAKDVTRGAVGVFGDSLRC